MASFIPAREASLVTFSNNFNTLIVATPTAFGLTAAQATAFTAVQTAFVTAYNVVHNSSTRSPANIITKDNAKKAMIASIRQLAGIIQKCPTVTNTQRSELGLNVKATPSPIPPPSVSPNMDIVSVTGRTVKIKLHDGSGTRRGKPNDVKGAAVFSFVGAEPPVAISAWKFEGNTTRVIVDVAFDSSLAPGATVWLTAFWFNERAQSGPACTPISTTFGAAGVSSMAA